LPEVLLYETSDPDFAERAVETLSQSEIPCRHSGTAYAALHPAQMGELGRGVCIFIERAEDYRRANEILIGMGAAVDAPTKLPSRAIVLAVAIALGVVIALLIANGGS
jgi:Putative prokaryotic signal transducing protein